MSGSHSGVQKMILLTVSNASYVHYCVYNLNTAKNTKEIGKLFDTVQTIFNLFSSGVLLRWNILVCRLFLWNVLKKIMMHKDSLNTTLVNQRV